MGFVKADEGRRSYCVADSLIQAQSTINEHMVTKYISLAREGTQSRRDGSAVKNTVFPKDCGSSPSTYLYGGSQAAVTPRARTVMPSSGLHGQWMQVVQIKADRAPRHIVFLFFKTHMMSP